MSAAPDLQACADRPYMDYSNATDISSQPYYRFLEATWYWQLLARYLITQVCRTTEKLSMSYLQQTIHCGVILPAYIVTAPVAQKAPLGPGCAECRTGKTSIAY